MWKLIFLFFMSVEYHHNMKAPHLLHQQWNTVLNSRYQCKQIGHSMGKTCLVVVSSIHNKTHKTVLIGFLWSLWCVILLHFATQMQTSVIGVHQNTSLKQSTKQSNHNNIIPLARESGRGLHQKPKWNNTESFNYFIRAQYICHTRNCTHDESVDLMLFSSII